MNRRLLVSPAAWPLLGSLLLAGCGQLPLTRLDDQHAMRDGWHRATIDRVVDAEGVPPVLRPDCPAAPDVRWALLDYRDVGRPRRAAVPVPAGMQASAGQPVLMQLQGCTRTLAPRSQP